jgi:hypothetical protein
MTETCELVQELSALAAGLCHDAGITLAARGERWSYDPLRRRLTVSEKDLHEKGRDWCAGRLVNEVGHYWLTRHDLFALRCRPEQGEERPFPSQLVGRLLMDVLDDPRVNAWMVARYPGSEGWLHNVRERSELGPVGPCERRGSDRGARAGSTCEARGVKRCDEVRSSEATHKHCVPLIIGFCVECMFEAEQGFAPSPWETDELVADALSRTREARRAYAAIAPSTSIGKLQEDDPIARFRERVMPALVFSLWVPPPYEAEIELRALEAAEIAQREILPVAAELWQHDADHIERWLAAHPLEQQRLEEGLDARQAHELFSRVGPVEGAPHCTPATAAGACKVLEALFRQEVPEDRVCTGGRARPAPARKGGWGASPKARLDVPPAPPTDYQRAFEEVADQIDRLVTMLERVLRPRHRLGDRSGYPSGRRVDLRKLMAFDADPRKYNELWVRSTIPERRRVVFSLLVDLSGSMYGEKTHAALLGTILLAETLHRLQIPFAIDAFQDVVIPLAPLHEPFGEHVRQAIAGMPAEVEGNRPGGNNQPGYNDDGPCVLEAANKLLAEPAEERILIVVSDGQPAGVRSTEDDLRATIAGLTSPGVPIELLGVGLGPDTEHVSTYYPQSVASVPLERFADEIGALIGRGLRVAL